MRLASSSLMPCARRVCVALRKAEPRRREKFSDDCASLPKAAAHLGREHGVLGRPQRDSPYDAAIADPVVGRRAHVERAIAAQDFDARDIAPRLAAVATGIHRQRAADGAGNAGQEFRLGASMIGGEARELRDSQARRPRR